MPECDGSNQIIENRVAEAKGLFQLRKTMLIVVPELDDREAKQKTHRSSHASGRIGPE